MTLVWIPSETFKGRASDSENHIEMKQVPMISIPLADLQRLTLAAMNLYLRLTGEHFVLVFRAGQALSVDQMDRWRKRGAHSLFVNRDEFVSYASQTVTMAGMMAGVENLEDRSRLSITAQAGTAVARELTNVPMSLSLFQHVEGLAEILERMAEQEMDVTSTLDGWARSGSRESLHAMMSTYVGLVTLKTLGWETPGLKRVLSVGGLLHDLGQNRLPYELRIKPREALKGDELTHYRSHPTYGVDLLQGFQFIEEGVVVLLKQHHEAFNGTGFPSGLKGSSIHPAARLFAAAHEFVKLVHPAIDGIAPLNPREAWGKLKEREVEFDPECFSGLGRALRYLSERAA